MKMNLDSLPERNIEDFKKNMNNHELIEYPDRTNIKTPLQQFYSNQCIFITGGSGFLGKILIEKLLRSCPDISRIYMLVRPKKGNPIVDRINQLLTDPLFSILKKTNPEFGKKIIGIPGDCSSETLGLSTENKKLLINEVSIVFHVAATVRFNEALKDAFAINVEGSSSIIDLCKNMKNLKSFIHVSTAYANCFSNFIEEKFYDYSVHYEDMVQLSKSSAEEVNGFTSKLKNQWPNTYTFTKALTEDLIRRRSENLPIGIFRPGIVIPTAEEPVPGWTDNYNGVTGFATCAMSGVLRTMICDSAKLANLIPVDLTINALITSAWDVASQNEKKGDNMLIYNFTSTVDAPLTWGQLLVYVTKFGREYPYKKALWYFTLIMQTDVFMHYLCSFFLHRIPSVLFDFFMVMTEEKPKLQKMYKKIDKLTDSLTFFCLNEWIFENNNVQNMWQRLSLEDKKIFNFSMKNFDWQIYCSNYIKGINRFLLKDTAVSDEDYEARSRKLYWNHQLLLLLVFSFLAFGCFFIWKNMMFSFSHLFSYY